MITGIYQKQSRILKYIGKQPFNQNETYIDSPYLIKAQDKEYLIIENLLTGEVIGQSLPINQKDFYFLVEHWFKIPKNFNIYNIYKKIQNHFSLAKMNYNNNNILNNFSQVILYSTMGCNANCYYCYEKKYRNVENKMTKQVIDDLIKLLIKKQKKEIKVSWFGGEPLFNIDIINYTYEQLQKYNISYKTSMITNGLLFNKESIQKAREFWNLRNLQITLDGSYDTYEKIKDVPQGSFIQLLDNIENLFKQNVTINFRLNIGLNNYDELLKTVKIIYKHFYQYNKIMSFDVHELFGLEKEKNIYDYVLKLQLYIESLFGHVHFQKFQWREHGCMADGQSTLTILPNGKIGLCEHNVFYDYYTDLNESFYDIDVINKYAGYQDKTECQLCPLRPGCIYNQACPSNGGRNCNKNRVNYIIYTKKKQLIQLAQKQRKRRRHLMITKELYTNIDIYNKATALIEAFNTQDGSDLNYPVKINFYLQKNMNALISLAREIEQKRMEIVQKYGNKKEDTEEYIIPEDKIEEATQELQDFFNLEQEVPISMMRLEWFDKIDMTAAQVSAISFMIEEEE